MGGRAPLIFCLVTSTIGACEVGDTREKSCRVKPECTGTLRDARASCGGLARNGKCSRDQQRRNAFPQFRFRGVNKATDVLSFPSATASASSVRAAREFAGELAISAEIALQNSLRLGHPATQEVKVLVLHGILHLAGLDHERDNGEMAREEAKLRRSLKLPASLTERGAAQDLAKVTVRSRRAWRTA